jgi:hypothetical protein
MHKGGAVLLQAMTWLTLQDVDLPQLDLSCAVHTSFVAAAHVVAHDVTLLTLLHCTAQHPVARHMSQ